MKRYDAKKDERSASWTKIGLASEAVIRGLIVGLAAAFEVRVQSLPFVLGLIVGYARTLNAIGNRPAQAEDGAKGPANRIAPSETLLYHPEALMVLNKMVLT